MSQASSPSAIAFGHYLLHRRLAQGGMAELFLATRRDDMNGHLFALKRVRPELADDPMLARMFLDELRLVGHLDHPNICKLHDSGQVDDTTYLVMDYVPGVDLWSLLRRGHPLPVDIPLHVAACVAGALAHAHGLTDASGRPLGIVHRDVTPHNVMLSFEGAVKLVDFGVAKARHQAEKTRSGILRGKYAYMSPEQTRGGALDGRSDLFALGATLYESLTGTRPFTGSSPERLVEAVQACSPTSPASLRPDLPAGVVEVVMTLLSREPAARGGGAREVAATLDSLLPDDPTPALRERMNAIFPQRRAAIDQVVEEVRAISSLSASAVDALTRSGGTVRDAPAPAFEDRTRNTAEPTSSPTGRRRPTGSAFSRVRDARRQRRLSWIAALVGVVVGSAAALALWQLVKPAPPAPPDQPVVRQIGE